MKTLSRGFLLTLSVALCVGVPPPAHAQSQTTVEKKVTTTNPSGMIVIDNETQHTFKLQGQTQVYTAPADVDLRSLSGKEVTVTTDANGNVTKVERKTTTTTVP